MPVKVEWNSEELAALHPGKVMPAIRRAVRKAGSTALRDMRSEAKKRIRQRKRIKAGVIGKAFRLRRPKGSKELDGGRWSLDVSGKPVSLTAYPHRATKKGVSVTVNRGKRTLIKGGFLATMTRAGGLGGSAVGAHAGHANIFKRLGKERLPIRKYLGSRPVDALMHKGEAEGVQDRGARSFNATFQRLLPMELERGKG